MTTETATRRNAFEQLGTALGDDAQTAEQALETANLAGWNVRKRPLSATLDNGLMLDVPGRAAVVRDHPITGMPEVLGDVGSDYHIVQNEQHAEYLNAIVDESGANFVSAGSMKGGRHVFMSMKLPGSILVGGSDPIDQYLTAINSQDGSLSYTLLVSPVRVICSNILNTDIARRSPIIRVRHTSGIHRNIVSKAREALGISFKFLEGFQAEAERMIDTALTDSAFEQIIAREFGAHEDAPQATITRCENKVDTMMDLFAEANTQKSIRNTAWAGYNALVEYADHFIPVRGSGTPEDLRAERVLSSGVFKARAKHLVMAGATS